MLDKVVAFDKSLFIYLNGLGSESFDDFWRLITWQFFWIPLFLFLAVIIYKKLGWRQSLLLALFIAALITLTDQTANLFKHNFHRLRPCSDPELKGIIRIVEERHSFSFFSAHAATSMAVTTFLFTLFRKHFRYFGFLFLWPLIFGYSRIYLGLHFPFDVLTGYVVGVIFAALTLFLYKKVKAKYLS